MDHPEPNIRGLPQDLSNHPYGEMGTGVTLDDSLLSPSDVAKREAMYKNHAFEEFISEMIPLNRSLPDYRKDIHFLNINSGIGSSTLELKPFLL